MSIGSILSGPYVRPQAPNGGNKYNFEYTGDVTLNCDSGGENET